MSKIYVVHGTVARYGRESSDRSDVVGTYTDENLAGRVRSAAGFGYIVTEIELGAIPSGLASFYKEITSKPIAG